MTKFKNTGILVLGHGSKLPYNKEVVEYVAEKIKEKNIVVRTAYLNMDRPSVQEGLDSFKGTDVDKIVALPVFLAHGVHTLEDIPEMLGVSKDTNKATIMLDGSKVELIYAEPLGAHEWIADLAYMRAEDAVNNRS